MKILLFSIVAALMNAQAPVAAKPAPAEPTKQTAPLERKFTQEEIDKLTLISAQMEVVRNRNKVDELEQQYKKYQDELAPIIARQEAIIEAACATVGVAKDKVKTGECGISLATDSLGKAIVRQDGKPAESKVWHIIPPPTPTSVHTPSN